MNRKDERVYQEWLDLRERIKSSTSPIKNEPHKTKQKRLRKLKRNFSAFCKYYFPHYLDSEFGYFHKEAALEIAHDKNIFAILEWPREHAKSVIACVFIPMWLHARDELDGMLLASANADKAKDLLGDIQAELLENQRFSSDYGKQASVGDWRDGHFMDAKGNGYWAFGRGQSPRGVRKAAKRPSFGLVDDIDDKVIVKNQGRVKEAVNWVLEDFFGALSIKAARLVIAGNRIDKKSILAHLVGDVEPEDPKRKGIYHSKVFAIESSKGVKGDELTGQPAWKERYNLEILTQRMEKMGYRSSRREYFHEHHEEGIIFKPEWIRYKAPEQRYEQLICYCDPSFKDTVKSDYKAIVLVGRYKSNIDVLWCWVRQATISSMVKVHYNLYEEYGSQARYYIEANMLQDLLLDDFDTEGDLRNYFMPIRPDRQKKHDKFTRIENMSPLFERGKIAFNELERSSVDMQTLVQQLLGFGDGGHDDAPDALEGAISKLQKSARSTSRNWRTGRRRRKGRGAPKKR